ERIAAFRRAIIRDQRHLWRRRQRDHARRFFEQRHSREESARLHARTAIVCTAFFHRWRSSGARRVVHSCLSAGLLWIATWGTSSPLIALRSARSPVRGS